VSGFGVRVSGRGAKMKGYMDVEDLEFTGSFAGFILRFVI